MNTARTIIGTMLAAAVALVGNAASATSARDSAMHRMHAEAARAPRTAFADYVVPDVLLVRADGTVVSLPTEMNDGRPVVLNFVFTTCGSICPMMSQVFSQFQGLLGPETAAVHMMSISTDPEQDTPARLSEYARKFHAGPQWQHYTGTPGASIAAQRAFDVYRGSKMSHTPVTLLRAAPGRPWLRIDGFVRSDRLMREYRRLLAAK